MVIKIRTEVHGGNVEEISVYLIGKVKLSGFIVKCSEKK